MTSDFVYGFLDESPGISDANYFFCVDIVVDSEKAGKKLSKIIRLARNRLNKKYKNTSELKFNNTDEKTRVFILSEIAKTNLGIVVLILDKDGRKIEDNPVNYGIAVGITIIESLAVYKNIVLTVDKRYKTGKDFLEFEKTAKNVFDKLSPRGTNFIFETPAESENNPGIQIADFVAGAFNAKYNRSNSCYAEILRGNIKKEIVAKWTETKKRVVSP
ncbi:MAG: DUF3800 domain-containing protein [bacterium]|nr:DUF3800 domain-containing protein [bacterium]